MSNSSLKNFNYLSDDKNDDAIMLFANSVRLNMMRIGD